MRIAFLFNSDHRSLGNYYGIPIAERLLDALVRQTVRTTTNISTGDVPASVCIDYRYAKQRIATWREVYTPSHFDHLLRSRFESVWGNSTIYCWLFHNVTEYSARGIHESLATGDDAYLGAMDVDFDRPAHAMVFRDQLIARYRIDGIQYSEIDISGGNDGTDIAVRDMFAKHGFSRVECAGNEVVQGGSVGTEGTTGSGEDNLR